MAPTVSNTVFLSLVLHVEDHTETDMQIIIGLQTIIRYRHSSVFPVDHPMAHIEPEDIIHDNRIKPGIGHVTAFQTPTRGSPASRQTIAQSITFHA